jgi:hypothetical protein
VPGGIVYPDPRIDQWIAQFQFSDVCGDVVGPVRVTAPPVFPAACGPGAATPVVLTNEDECGFAFSVTRTVTVVDQAPPVVQPLECTAECTADGGTPYNDPALQACLSSCQAVDACEGPVACQVNVPPPDTFPGGCAPGQTTPISLTGRDSCNNQATGIGSVTIVDTQGPEITGCKLEPQFPPFADGCDAGKPVELVFEYTGESCAASNNQQAVPNKFECSGDPMLAQPVQVVPLDSSYTVDPAGQVVNIGDRITVTAQGGRFPANTYLEVRRNGVLLQYLKIHTSCSAPLNVGDQFGSLILREFVPSTVKPPQPPGTATSCISSAAVFRVQCADATGGLTDLCGSEPIAVTAELVVRTTERGDLPCTLEVKEEIVPVACDELLQVQLARPPCPARSAQNVTSARKPRTALSVTSDGFKVITGEEVILRVKAVDACGNESDPDCEFNVLDARDPTRPDDPVICVPTPVVCPECGPASGCDVGKPSVLEFEYTGESCAASNNQQPIPNKFECSGDPMLAQPVEVVSLEPSRYGVSPGGEVVLIGGRIRVTAVGGTFPANTYLEVRQGGQRLQYLKIHTSCSAPLNVGDQFGSLILREFIPAELLPGLEGGGAGRARRAPAEPATRPDDLPSLVPGPASGRSRPQPRD